MKLGPPTNFIHFVEVEARESLGHMASRRWQFIHRSSIWSSEPSGIRVDWRVRLDWKRAGIDEDAGRRSRIASGATRAVRVGASSNPVCQPLGCDRAYERLVDCCALGPELEGVAVLQGARLCTLLHQRGCERPTSSRRRRTVSSRPRTTLGDPKRWAEALITAGVSSAHACAGLLAGRPRLPQILGSSSRNAGNSSSEPIILCATQGQTDEDVRAGGALRTSEPRSHHRRRSTGRRRHPLTIDAGRGPLARQN
jgi:hypothetical protein